MKKIKEVMKVWHSWTNKNENTFLLWSKAVPNEIFQTLRQTRGKTMRPYTVPKKSISAKTSQLENSKRPHSQAPSADIRYSIKYQLPRFQLNEEA